MKKLIGIVVALALVLAMLPVAAFAANNYYVAGVSALCGSNWSQNDAKNVMTANGDVYTKTYSNVKVGTYEFKITDGTWNNSWGDGSGNYKFAVTTAGDITITFNSSTKKITVSGTGVGEAKMEIKYVTAVGAGKGGFLNNVDWNPAAASNKMTEENGVYTITYTDVAAGTYEYKFAANGAWTDNWGFGGTTESGKTVNAVYNSGSNAKVVVAENGSTVELKLDLSAMDSKGNGAKITTTVTAPVVEEEVTDIKFQAKGNSLRLVTWVDSLDYQEVVFNVTVDGETAAIPCTTVYSAINAGDAKLDNAAEIFNENALYFVTYTIESIPEGVTEFDVSVTWTDLEGNSNTSDVRTITL